MNIAIIGTGGIGQWTAQIMARMLGEKDCILLIDGDTVEPHNIDRQYQSSDIGSFKSKCLMDFIAPMTKAWVFSHPEYLSPGNIDNLLHDRDAVFLCVDNHAARALVLDYADREGVRVFNGANEYTDSEAWYYDTFMKDSPEDPRVRFPELLTDKTGNPLAPCTGAAQESAPQLALANMGAAYMQCHLWYMHTHAHVDRKMSAMDVMTILPIHHTANFARMRSISPDDINKEAK